MAANSSGSSRLRPPPGFLTRISVEELKLFRVAIKRSITTSGPIGPLERSIDDPKQLIPLVHIKKEGRNSKSIFDREDVLVNQEDRLVLADANRLETHRVHRSRSYSRSKSQSPSKHRSASPSYRSRSTSHSKNRSREKGKQTFLERDVQKRKSPDRRRSVDKNRDKRSLDRRRSLEKEDAGRNFNKVHRKSSDSERDKRFYRERPNSNERDEERHRRRSRTPVRSGDYRQSHSDIRPRSRERGHSRDKYRSSIKYDRYSRRPSRSPDSHRGSPVKNRSRSPHASSRSRSPRKHGRSPHGDRNAAFAFYEGMIPGSEYWIPAPIRPGFPVPPGYGYTPGFFPRMPGAPFIPPRMPMVAPYVYRHMIPVYNSLKPRPKVSTQIQPGSGNVSAKVAGQAMKED